MRASPPQAGIPPVSRVFVRQEQPLDIQPSFARGLFIPAPIVVAPPRGTFAILPPQQPVNGASIFWAGVAPISIVPPPVVPPVNVPGPSDGDENWRKWKEWKENKRKRKNPDMLLAANLAAIKAQQAKKKAEDDDDDDAIAMLMDW